MGKIERINDAFQTEQIRKPDKKLLDFFNSQVYNKLSLIITEDSSMAEILVETSARHIHVTREHLEILFGKGATLTKKKDLSQPGQYACEERDRKSVV